MTDIAGIIATELNKPQNYVENVIKLYDEGCTIPFIARYRKEAHGAMDDSALRELEEKLNRLRNLEARKEEVIKSIDSQEKLTDELKKQIKNAKTLSEVEDIYRPFKQKRRTRAVIAKEKGLEPLALTFYMQDPKMGKIEDLAKKYIDPEKGVESIEDALNGASDIIAEMVSDSVDVRKQLRNLYMKKGSLRSSASKEEDSVYSGYYDFVSSLNKIQGHQVLAVNRGEKEGFLKVKIDVDEAEALAVIEKQMIKGESNAKSFLKDAIKDGYERLLAPSMENEVRAAITESACEGAIHNFSLNLKPLLMQPPVKGKVTMGLDPGYRMGCKVAVIDETGKVLDTTVVYPTHGEKQKEECITKLSGMIKKWNVKHIAIGSIGPGHHVFIEGNRHETHDEAHDDGRHRNTGKADAAGLHGRDLAVAGQAAKSQECGQQHGHREGPDDYLGQAEDEDLHHGLQRSTIVRDIFGNLEKGTGTDKHRGESTDAKDKGQRHLAEYIFV